MPIYLTRRRGGTEFPLSDHISYQERTPRLAPILWQAEEIPRYGCPRNRHGMTLGAGYTRRARTHPASFHDHGRGMTLGLPSNNCVGASNVMCTGAGSSSYVVSQPTHMSQTKSATYLLSGDCTAPPAPCNDVGWEPPRLRVIHARQIKSGVTPQPAVPNHALHWSYLSPRTHHNAYSVTAIMANMWHNKSTIYNSSDYQ